MESEKTQNQIKKALEECLKIEKILKDIILTLPTGPDSEKLRSVLNMQEFIKTKLLMQTQATTLHKAINEAIKETNKLLGGI